MKLSEYLNFFAILEGIPFRGTVIMAEALKDTTMEEIKACDSDIEYKNLTYKVTDVEGPRGSKSSNVLKGQQVGLVVKEVKQVQYKYAILNKDSAIELMNALEYYSDRDECENRNEILALRDFILESRNREESVDIFLRFTPDSYAKTKENINNLSRV